MLLLLLLGPPLGCMRSPQVEEPGSHWRLPLPRALAILSQPCGAHGVQRPSQRLSRPQDPCPGS